MVDREHDRQRRPVASRDPSLSPRANRALTEELQAVVGRPQAEVPAGRPRRAGERHGGRPGLLVELSVHRLAIGMTLAGAVVVGAVLTLATGSWWFLLLALAAHALGTVAVLALVLHMTTEVEHVSPTAAALLEDEGVRDPDAVLNDLVDEVAHDDAGDGGDRGQRRRPVGRSIARDERDAPTADDPASATAEQKSAMTPTQEPSRPVGPS